MFCPRKASTGVRVDRSSPVRRSWPAWGGLCLLLLSGCSPPPVTFTPNAVFATKLERELGQSLEEATADVQAILVDQFGTPDAPLLPTALTGDPALRGLMDLDRLSRAAGAVSSDREGAHRGLYREHCSNCHGVSGDGLGPAALFQNPYPRDYRAGIFKYKSTPRGAKPTRQDLAQTVLQGLPGTSMPAFALLASDGGEDDIEALLDYVIYLSIRGELERRLLTAAATEYHYAEEAAEADRLIRPADRERAPEAYAEQLAWIDSEVRDIAGRWVAAESRVPSIPPSPLRLQAASAEDEFPHRAATAEGEAALRESVAIGRELFHGQIANCSSCHGIDGAGGTLPADYDDWTKEWTTQLGLDPQDKAALEPFLEAGALPPRSLPARRLTLGGFRGGDTPEELYRRILHGIDGTPMPAVNLVETESETGLTADQIWHLVHYVLSLGPEQLATATAGAEANHSGAVQ